MGLTSLLCLALLTGLIALLMESASIATMYWAAAAEKGSFERYLFYNYSLDLSLVPEDFVPPPRPTPRKLLRNKGFWSYCEYLYLTDEKIEELYNTSAPSYVEPENKIYTECKAVNFSGREEIIPEPHEAVLAHMSTIFFLDRAASGFACICVGLQLCAVLTSFQAAYTTVPVLFTDCGVMFLFGAFFQLGCMVLFMISMSIGILERPVQMEVIPPDYELEYSYSFYLGWGSFIFSLVTGISYLLLARAWETEEVWLKPMGKEKKGGSL